MASRIGQLASFVLPVAVAGVVALLVFTADEPAATQSPAPRVAQAPGKGPVRDRAQAVRGLYERAIAGNFAGSWALAGPKMRRALGDRSGMVKALKSLERIEFQELRAEGELVRVRSVGTYTNRIQRCSGTLLTVRGRNGAVRVEPHRLFCSVTLRR